MPRISATPILITTNNDPTVLSIAPISVNIGSSHFLATKPFPLRTKHLSPTSCQVECLAAKSDYMLFYYC